MKTYIKPWTIDLDKYPDVFLESIADFCGSLLSVVNSLEIVMRQFHPHRIIDIQKALSPFNDRMKNAARLFGNAVETFGGDNLTDQLGMAAEKTNRCLDNIMGIDQPQTVIKNLLKAMRQHYRSQELLYPLIVGLKPVGRYFLEPSVRERLEDYSPCSENSSQTGLFLDSDSGAFYVPETYDGQQGWPLVVALHGGSGIGRDFIWLWMREARSRRFLLLAPSSADRTWSFGSSADADRITDMIDTLSKQWRVDKKRMLLTGMSDGAIYTLNWGLRKNAPFSAMAPISGVLHPVDLSFASGKRIYLVHGLLDWMFPVQYAHQAANLLKQAGAEIEFREIADLSHTYPREENAKILSWFDSNLTLAGSDHPG